LFIAGSEIVGTHLDSQVNFETDSCEMHLKCKNLLY